ncbi:MAG: ABC transporter permease [Eubacteriales Family XIII. Incertae Sedis bacterium]|nr:MAG: ABC transporter permease [Clostridiales Family XIII bacterium]
MFSSLRYSVKQAFVQVFRNRAMSLASMFSITAMLLILGLFFVIMVNIGVGIEKAKTEFDSVSAYLEDTTTYEEAQTMMLQLSGMNEVNEVYYLDKDTAMAQWKAQEWQDNAYLLDGLVENPLPNSIEVKVTKLEDADRVVEVLNTFNGIKQVKYYKETVDKLVKITDSLKVGMLVIMAFLVIVSVVVVSNTVKLTVFARQKEIEIMKYVGATNWFIRGPFLAEGILIGILSAGISVGITALVYKKVIDMLSLNMSLILGSPMVSVGFMTSNLVFIFMALGVSIGAWGSIISMRRFLDT